MKISIITVFPELYEQFLKTSLIKKAQENKIVSFNIVRLSDMCSPKERIDEPVCGPGTGMIIKPQVIEKAIEHCEKEYGPAYKIFFSPQGKRLTQPLLTELSKFVTKKKNSKKVDFQNHIMLICSRYEGIDERVKEEFANLVVSIGDYVLMGGDIPAQVFLEGFLRLVPTVVGKEESVKDESFSGPFFDYPEYGLPKSWRERTIPEVILSGDHSKIEKWRKNEACKKTILHRFDWFRTHAEKNNDIELAQKNIPNHYVALMHTQIIIKGGRIGHSSVTSLDLHDIARSSATYGIKNTFMVSPLKDQQAIMNDLLSFWKSESGEKYNKSRYDAVSRVVVSDSLQKTIDSIEKQEGQKPLVITTSAKEHRCEKIHDRPEIIDYSSQDLVWSKNRPVLFIFGTAQGLSEKVICESDYLLIPVSGMTKYRHLSVRSAVGIILDRWLGLNRQIARIGL
jgi:tRNA (guanine37-N1)-methyltransferase